MIKLRLQLPIVMILTFCGCQNFTKHSTSIFKKTEKDTLSEIDIKLYPSFIHSSTIKIDRVKDRVTFTIDSGFGMDSFPKPVIAPFTANLRKYEISTDIKSFYDTGFINSIKRDRRRPGYFDGISIVILFVRGNKIDTIEPGNNFPKPLSDNLTKQINFISNSSHDNALREYLKNLKMYFD